MKTKLTAIIFGLMAFGLILGGRAGAAAPTGLTVSPAFQMVTIQAGALTQPVSFQITNDRPVAQNLSFSVRDFGALNDSGGLFFVGTNPTALQKKYGLVKWMSLPASNVTLQPHQTFTLNAQVLNQPDLAGGGHYGALMIAPTAGSAAGQVGFQPIASSLLFVTKPQGAIYQLDLNNVYFNNSIFNLPGSVTLRFQNNGNTHVIPRGSVYINNPQGRLVSKGIINEDSNIILPSTYRQYKVALNKVSQSTGAGIYKLHVDFRFDGTDQFRGYQKNLAHISLADFALIVLFLIILAGLAIAWAHKRLASNKPK